MRVLLVSANTEQINMPTLPLGLACVAAATRSAGHDVELVDLIAEDEDLLFPRFYMVKELEDWLPKTVSTWMNERPHWYR